MTEEKVVKTHLGVYAFIYSEDRKSILLIKKARGPYTGLYDLPGGTIEPEELIQETLGREIKEETSCDMIHCAQLCAVDTRFDWNREAEGKPNALFKHIGILYLAGVSGEPSTKGDGLDSNGAEWIKVEDIENGTIKVSPFTKMGLQYMSEMDE